MHVEKIWFDGDISDLPFPALLFRLWRAKRTGTLSIDTGKIAQIHFRNGNICIPAESVKDKSFTRAVLKKIRSDPALGSVPSSAPAAPKSVTSYMERGFLSPGDLWRIMKSVVAASLLPLFDCPKAEYNFNSERDWEEHDILFYLTTLDFILEGIREMRDYSLIDAHLPPPEKHLDLLSPDHLHQVRLNGPEIYLYHVIESKKSLKKIYADSQLGKKETKKMIFSFLNLGIVGLPDTKVLPHNDSDFSQADLYHLLDAFNQKCSFVFKYLTKEIGPAAWNVLVKCVDDTRASLSPLFQNLQFDAEGRIEPGSIQIAASGIPGKNLRDILLRDLNEVLAAEVLAVKKSLGNDHESSLVESLRKVGEWS